MQSNSVSAALPAQHDQRVPSVQHGFFRSAHNVFSFQCFQFSVFNVFIVQCSQSRAVRRADGGSCWSYPAKRRGVCALFGRSGGYDGGVGGFWGAVTKYISM